jgi:hypothetical protein
MFGKSIKHELRATRRSLLPLLIAMLAVSLFIGFLFLADGFLFTNADTDSFAIFSSFFSAILILGLTALGVAVAVVSFIMIIRRFYTSFFTDEGYLTFTLPVTVNQHIMSKFTVAFVWQVVSSVVALLCVALIGAGALLGYGVADEFWVEMKEAFSAISFLFDGMVDMYGVGNVTFGIVLAIAQMILNLVASIFMLYLAISLACMLAKRHRVLCGIACYFVINMVFSSLTSLANSLAEIVDGDYAFYVFMISTVVLTLIQILVSYIFTKWILTKKLNLD